jgi:hypothetical protein
MDRNVVSYEPLPAQVSQPRSTSLLEAATSDILARLQTLPIKNVEAALSRRYRKSDPDCSLLSYLRTPGNGFTHAQAATRILEELADGIEDVSTTTSLVVRYVQAHRLWTNHPNPAVDSLEALLGTVDGIQYVQAGTVIGTSSQLMRARAIRLIEKHWGSDWFEKIPTDMKDTTWSRASDCSHQLLRLIAANAKQGVELDAAKCAWAQSIRRRRDERVRKELRMRCPRFPFIITDDVRSVNHVLGLDRQACHTSEIVYPEELAEDQLRAELVTPGSKRSAPFVPELCANEPGQRKRQKRPQQDSGVDDRTRGHADYNNGGRVSDNGRWKQRRDGNQFVRVPLADDDESHLPSELSSTESTPPTPHVANDMMKKRVKSTGWVSCDGPSVATKLRRIVGTIVSRDREDSTSVKLAGYCCTACRSKIDVLDEMLKGVMRVATLLENLTDHQAVMARSVDSQNPESAPPTPQLPRLYRLWLPIDSESDGKVCTAALGSETGVTD